MRPVETQESFSHFLQPLCGCTVNVFSLSLSLTHSVIDQSKYLQLSTLKIRQEITIKPDIAKDFPPLEEAAGG